MRQEGINDLKTLRADLRELRKSPDVFKNEIAEMEAAISEALAEAGKGYWVADLSRKQKFGPYPTKKDAAKARTQIRLVSDMFCEIGTNVGIFTKDTAEAEEFMPWPIGSMKDVEEQNRRLKGPPEIAAVVINAERAKLKA